MKTLIAVVFSIMVASIANAGFGTGMLFGMAAAGGSNSIDSIASNPMMLYVANLKGKKLVDTQQITVQRMGLRHSDVDKQGVLFLDVKKKITDRTLDGHTVLSMWLIDGKEYVQIWMLSTPTANIVME